MLYVNKKKLLHMVTLATYEDVTKTITKCADPNKFYVIQDKGWCAIIPKDIKHYVPAIVTYDYDKAGCYVVKELVTRDYDNFIYLIFDGVKGELEFELSDEYEVITKDIKDRINLDGVLPLTREEPQPIEMAYIGVTLNELAFGLPDSSYGFTSHGTENTDENSRSS